MPSLPDLTLARIFQDAVDRPGARPALQWKQGGQWRSMAYAELGVHVREFAAGLLALGMDRGDRLAIFSKNNKEWAIADWAAVTHGFVTVPIYDSLTAEKAAYILKDSGARVVVVQTLDHLNKIRSVRKALPALRYVVLIEEIFEKQLEPSEYLFDQVYEQGRKQAGKHGTELGKRRSSIKPDDLASIVYTSGTTGEPKGALLTHGNFASNVTTALEMIRIDAGDVALSFLPLSHVFERMAGHFTLVKAGATIAYAESIEKVPENLLEVRPHLMMSVPRLYEKLYARIQEKVRGESFLRRWIFRRAIDVGKRQVHQKYDLRVEDVGLTRSWKRYDRLVYSKLRARLGGRINFFVSGGAPLSREIHEFFTAAGMPILQGYGLTETSPVIAANCLESGFRLGSVGKPWPGSDVQIAQDGEILVKGPMVFKGYHNKKKETDEAFTRDGYFKTGDIGRVDEDGYLFVTDRKKEILVMSNGKKVAPQPIENELKTKPGVGVAILLGNDRPFIGALLAPDFEALKKEAKRLGIKSEDPKELLGRPEVQALFQRSVATVNESLSQYEKIKKFKVLPAEITPQSEELTPTLKVKRRVVDQKYKALIDELYSRDASSAP